MRVLFATAELSPLASVGGLANAAAGLVAELRRQGVAVTAVLPDYGEIELEGEQSRPVDAPAWVGGARVRWGRHPVVGEVHLVDLPGIARPHPYLQPGGAGWPDNDHRFLAFSAVVAALWAEGGHDVLHLNDWHTAAALAAFEPPPPSVLSIHNLAYQGWCDGGWLGILGPRGSWFESYGGCNPMKGGLVIADAVVAVSPNYAEEIRRPESGFGLDGILRDRGDAVVGILNGIDTSVWDPAHDPRLVEPFDATRLQRKIATTQAVRERLRLGADGPLVVAVTRLTDQKGTDLLPALVPYLAGLPAQVAVLGAGDAWQAQALHEAAAAAPDRLAFVEGYDDALAHQLLGGGDLLLMPSRFEPCGLSQMQAMRYGTIPVATDVGGLHDTILDDDAYRGSGTGFLARRAEVIDVLDALHRGVRAWADPTRRAGIQRRGMAVDWSWAEPARRHLDLYHRVAATH